MMATDSFIHRGEGETRLLGGVLEVSDEVCARVSWV